MAFKHFTLSHFINYFNTAPCTVIHTTQRLFPNIVVCRGSCEMEPFNHLSNSIYPLEQGRLEPRLPKICYLLDSTSADPHKRTLKTLLGDEVGPFTRKTFRNTYQNSPGTTNTCRSWQPKMWEEMNWVEGEILITMMFGRKQSRVGFLHDSVY